MDLLIGTHKLLQKSMAFKDLGLLVIDEEQRFGVTHKERLKEMSRQVDVLTLSATPIPRTLNMAFPASGTCPPWRSPQTASRCRPMCWSTTGPSLGTPCAGSWAGAARSTTSTTGWRPSTHRRPHPEDAGAGGPDRVGHGKMSEEELSSVMQAMVDGEADMLVCTTIIETGIDIPNVNTLIIEDADKMGLAQLHQIRGRVGRTSRRAYAYLTYRRGKVLQEVAAKRLAAIREYVEFGSGFKIAMRDLEIRGAGNLLGPGAVAAIS